MDTDPGASNEVGVEKFEEVLEDDDTGAEYEDSDFSTDSESASQSVFVETPKRKKGTVGPRASPITPVKAGRGKKRVSSEENEEESPSERVKQWMYASPGEDVQGKHCNNMLKIFDENNVPITGYRAAAPAQKSDLQQKNVEEIHSKDGETIVLRRDSPF